MIRFGPSGIGSEPERFFAELSKAGLMCAEVSFTHGVRMRIERAKEIGKAAVRSGIRLSVHSPYYINLLSDDKIVVANSIQRIIDSCERAHYLGADQVVFHPGYYVGKDSERCITLACEAIELMNAEIRKEGWETNLSPETSGKASQFGSLDETLLLSKRTGCSATIDFAHLCAREGKCIDFGPVVKRLPWKRIHCHMSGIEWGPKGERRHILLEKKAFMPLAAALGRIEKRDVTVICESPEPLEDAKRMKEWYSESK
jgi:deoxyribonuclease IV